MQFQFLPQEERFYVRISPEACELYPEGAFSDIINYPVYAIRARIVDDEDITEFFIPSSDGDFFWMDMRQTRLVRR